MSDVLSDVLRAVRLSGAVYFKVDAVAPWVAEAPASAELAPHILGGAEHVIEYHVVTEGRCWGALLDGPAVELQAGDVIVFPQGDAHVLSSEPGMRGTPLAAEAFRDPTRLPLVLDLQGDGSARSRLVCGFLGCDARPFNPLLGALPRVMHVPTGSGADSILGQLVELASQESRSPKAGSLCVLSRLSELLFIEVVRRYLAALPPEHAGWVAALRDPHIGRALHELHARPAHAWSLEELAREVGLSRSVLAERFAHFVGIPPIQYLAEWRIQLAASLLRGSKKGLAEIADSVGYGSEAALSRAFKRCVGIAPAQYRQRSAPIASASSDAE